MTRRLVLGGIVRRGEHRDAVGLGEVFEVLAQQRAVGDDQRPHPGLYRVALHVGPVADDYDDGVLRLGVQMPLEALGLQRGHQDVRLELLVGAERAYRLRLDRRLEP
ncbi:MAG: hypothetical protein MZV63_46720 [Marinilabiliales bacterium]|nr:hypothetical protein [Marinilabiliales bacterium]